MHLSAQNNLAVPIEGEKNISTSPAEKFRSKIGLPHFARGTSPSSPKWITLPLIHILIQKMLHLHSVGITSI